MEMNDKFSIEHIDKAIEKLNEHHEQSIADDLKAYFTQMLHNADFVQVVRCEKCKYFNKKYIAYNVDNIEIYWCNKNEWWFSPNDFCSKGKRRKSK